MAIHKTDICWGVMMARDELDRDVGHQGYMIVRGERKGQGVRTLIGPVCESYSEAREHVWAYQVEHGFDSQP